MSTTQRSYTPPTSYTPPGTPIPIQVFISSDSDEFEKLRDDLREYIDTEYMYNDKRTYDEDDPSKAKLVHQGVMLKGLIVEEGSAETFEERMKNGLDTSQIYVGIFGNQYSPVTIREYEYASKLGLPLLVYYFTEPGRIAKGVKTKMVAYLKKNVRKELVIRGNYKRIEARTPTDLIDLILSDLARKVADNVREAIALRAMLIKAAPDSTIGAVLKAKKPAFSSE